MHRIIPEIHFLPKTFLPPELHCLIAELVGKNINNIRLLGLLCLRSFTTLQGEQA
jgi:hypothetical protein